MTHESATSHFHKGIISLYSGKYHYAEKFFYKASQLVDQLEPEYQRYLSYQGLAQVLENKKSGVRNCYSEFKVSDIEVLLNKAIAELLIGHRKRSIDAIKEIPNTSENKKLIDCFYQVAGKRKSSRASITNKTFGKFLRKGIKQSNSIKIKDCIHKQMDILYKSEILNYKKQGKSLKNRI